MRSDHRHLTAYQIGCEVGQSVGLVLRPAILDRHILALDVAVFTKALAECGQMAARSTGAELLRNPITGIAGCCARAASGHVAAALPSVTINSRRRMWIAMRPSQGGHARAMGAHSILKARVRAIQEQN